MTPFFILKVITFLSLYFNFYNIIIDFKIIIAPFPLSFSFLQFHLGILSHLSNLQFLFISLLLCKYIFQNCRAGFFIGVVLVWEKTCCSYNVLSFREKNKRHGPDIVYWSVGVMLLSVNKPCCVNRSSLFQFPWMPAQSCLYLLLWHNALLILMQSLLPKRKGIVFSVLSVQLFASEILCKGYLKNSWLWNLENNIEWCYAVSTSELLLFFYW